MRAAVQEEAIRQGLEQALAITSTEFLVSATTKIPQQRGQKALCFPLGTHQRSRCSRARSVRLTSRIPQGLAAGFLCKGSRLDPEFSSTRGFGQAEHHARGTAPGQRERGAQREPGGRDLQAAGTA